LHSLGDFILQNDTVAAYPLDAYRRFGLGPDATPADFLDTRSRNDTKGFAATEGYWRSVVAACEFRDRKLSAVKLHPVDIGYGKSRAQRGRPLLARNNVANQTLQRIKYLSERYGTVMKIENDIATIDLGS
jgi:poly-gamma-glutamate synthesis protein (capsule biosynthesis protein)